MTPKETIEKLEAITNNDPEEDHLNADNYLLDLLESLGHKAVVTAFDNARNRGRGFWYS